MRERIRSLMPRLLPRLGPRLETKMGDGNGCERHARLDGWVRRFNRDGTREHGVLEILWIDSCNDALDHYAFSSGRARRWVLLYFRFSRPLQRALIQD